MSCSSFQPLVVHSMMSNETVSAVSVGLEGAALCALLVLGFGCRFRVCVCTFVIVPQVYPPMCIRYRIVVFQWVTAIHPLCPMSENVTKSCFGVHSLSDKTGRQI